MPHAPQKAGRHLSRFPKVRQVTDGDHRYSRIAADPHVRSRILRFTQRQYGGSSIAHLCGGLPPQRTAMLVGGNAQPTKRPIYDRFVAGVLEYDRRKARMQWMHAEAIEYAYDQIGLSLAMKEAALLLFQILQDSYAWRYRRVPVDVYLRFVKKNSAQLLEHEIESARCPKSLHRWLTSSSWWWPPSFRLQGIAVIREGVVREYGYESWNSETYRSDYLKGIPWIKAPSTVVDQVFYSRGTMNETRLAKK